MKLTAPAVVEKPRPLKSWLRYRLLQFSVLPWRAASSVSVLEEKHVAGYDAAVLAANDAKALGDWLREHQYDFPPELVAWAGVYAKAGWVVTALKLSPRPRRTRTRASYIRRAA